MRVLLNQNLALEKLGSISNFAVNKQTSAVSDVKKVNIRSMAMWAPG